MSKKILWITVVGGLLIFGYLWWGLLPSNRIDFQYDLKDKNNKILSSIICKNQVVRFVGNEKDIPDMVKAFKKYVFDTMVKNSVKQLNFGTYGFTYFSITNTIINKKNRLTFKGFPGDKITTKFFRELCN